MRTSRSWLIGGSSASLLAILACPGGAQQWQTIAGTARPAPRDVAMCRDVDRDRTVCVSNDVFLSGSGFRTWERVGGEWVLREPGGPTPAVSVSESLQVAWHPMRRATMLCTGGGATWLYDGRDWLPVPTATWQDADEPSLCWDEARNVMVLFDSGQFWEYDIAGSWQPVGAPLLVNGLPLRAARIAYDPQNQDVLLFGGRSGAATSDRTFRYDGIGATQVSPPTVPWPRVRHQLTTDPTIGRVVLTGGHLALAGTGNDCIEQVHEWSGSDWVPAPPLPRGLARHSIAAEPGGLFVYGGEDAYGNPWVTLRRDAVGSFAVEFYGVCYPSSNAWTHDFSRGVTVAVSCRQSFGSEVHEFDGYQWRTVTTVGLGAASIVQIGWHPNNGVIGLTPNGATWAYDGVAWSPLNAVGPTQPATLSFDPVLGRTVLFVAAGSVPGPLANETWLWDGSTWTTASPLTMPPPTELPAMCFDPSVGTTFLVRVVGNVAAPDAWRYDGVTWTRAAGSVPPLLFPRIAGHPSLGVVLVGRVAAGSTTQAFFRYDGATWQTLPAPQVDLPFFRLVYDSSRDAILAHGQPWCDQVLTTTPASNSVYGSGCSGSGGIARLGAGNLPDLGATVISEVDVVRANAPVVLFADLAPANVALPGGCRQLVQRPLLIDVAASSQSGFATLTWDVPRSTALRGVVVYEQALALDSNGSFLGFAVLSNGLARTIGG